MATKKATTGAARPKLGSSHAGAKKTTKPGKPVAGKAKAPPAARSKPKAAPKSASGAARSSKPSAASPRPSTRPSARPAAKPARTSKAPPSRRSSSLEGPKSRRTTESTATDETRGLALSVAGAALDKKALNVQILDVSGRVDYADFLVLMSGRSDRHVTSIADSIEAALVALTPKRKPSSVEGRSLGEWIILDFGDLIAHVFQEEARASYDLDTLWAEARKVPLPAGQSQQDG